MVYAKEIFVKNEVYPNYPPKKMGILGGTFNPVHCGHIELAKHVKQELGLDEILLMPCANPPHKDEILATPQQRLHMVKLCETHDISASDMEIKRAGTTYTIDTMRQLTQLYQNTEFTFIIGADTLFELCSWKNCREIFRLTKFVCVRRKNVTGLCAEMQKLKENYGADITLSAYTGLFVSSSYIRSRVEKGCAISGLVPKKVEEYIIANGLYQR